MRRGSLETVIADYPRYEEAIEIAWKKRPELSDYRHRIEIGKELVTIANAGDKPRLDFKGGFGWSNLDMGGDFQADGPNWSAGLFVTFPIFDGLRTRGKVGVAKSDLSTLRIEEAKLRDSIALQVPRCLQCCERGRRDCKGPVRNSDPGGTPPLHGGEGV